MTATGTAKLTAEARRTGQTAIRWARDGWEVYARAAAALSAHHARQATRTAGEKSFGPCIRCLDFAADERGRA
jgi:hypothetical protein